MFSQVHESIPPHVPTDEKRKTFETIAGLLQRGGRCIAGNQWKIRPGGKGYFEITITHQGNTYTFELDGCIPVPLPVDVQASVR